MPLYIFDTHCITTTVLTYCDPSTNPWLTSSCSLSPMFGINAPERHSKSAQKPSVNRDQIRRLYGASGLAEWSRFPLVPGPGLWLCRDRLWMRLLSTHQVRTTWLWLELLLPLQGWVASGSDLRCGQSVQTQSDESAVRQHQPGLATQGRHQAMSTVPSIDCEDERRIV